MDEWIVLLVQVIVYDAVTRKIRRTYARFKDRAYSGTLRADGNLLVAGGEDGVVQVTGLCSLLDMPSTCCCGFSTCLKPALITLHAYQPGQ